MPIEICATWLIFIKNNVLKFLILCSHRPLDLDNIYNQDQIKILMKEGETLEVPEFDDIYASSDVCNVMPNVFTQTAEFSSTRP